MSARAAALVPFLVALLWAAPTYGQESAPHRTRGMYLHVGLPSISFSRPDGASGSGLGEHGLYVGELATGYQITPWLAADVAFDYGLHDGPVGDHWEVLLRLWAIPIDFWVSPLVSVAVGAGRDGVTHGDDPTHEPSFVARLGGGVGFFFAERHAVLARVEVGWTRELFEVIPILAYRVTLSELEEQ